MASRERSLILRIKAQVDGAKRELDAVADSARKVGKAADDSSKVATTAGGRMVQSARENRQAWDTIGTSVTAFGAATAFALGGSAKAAIDWDSAWTGVTKTVEGSATQLAALEGGLRGMARELPATHGEIAAVAEAAGALGIATPNVESFTKTMIDLGETTNLSADQAATALARFANVMGTSQDEFDNIGSAIVELGNKYASTEAEITEMSTRLAGAGRQAKLSEGEVLGLATALSSVGIEAEAGGTAFSRVLIEMSKAAETGSDSLETFAAVAGVSAAEFQSMWSTDPGSAIAAFISGMGSMEASGQSIQPVLEELGMTDIRVGDALRRSAGAADLFTSAMETGNEAYEQNTALAAEAEKRYGTVAAQLDMARNSVMDAAISFGEVLLPAITGAAEGVALIADTLGSLPSWAQAAIVGIGGLAAAVSLLGGGALLMVPRLIEGRDALRELGAISPRTSDAIGKVGKAAGSAAKLLGVAGLVGALSAVGAAIVDTEIGLEELEQRLLNMGSGGSFSDLLGLGDVNLDEMLGQLADESWWETPVNGAARLAENLAGLVGADIRSDFGRLEDGLVELDGLLARTARASLPDAQEQFRQLAEMTDGSDRSIRNLLSALPEYEAALLAAATEQGYVVSTGTGMNRVLEELQGQVDPTRKSVSLLDLATGDFVFTAEDAAKATEGVTEVAGEFQAEADAAAEAVMKWRGELAGIDADFINLSDALGATQQASQDWAQKTADATESADDSWEDFYDGQSVNLEKYLTNLETMVEAQQNWETNMLLLSGRVSQGVLDELARMGPEGAPLVAELVDASDAELARMEAIFGQRGADATGAYASELQAAIDSGLFAAAGAQLGEQVSSEIAAKIAAGELTVEQAVAEYDIYLPVDADLSGAEQRIAGIIERTTASSATLGLKANPQEFDGTLNSALRRANASTGTPDLKANRSPFDGTVNSAIRWADGRSATASLYLDSSAAYGSLWAFVGTVRAQRPVIRVGMSRLALATGGYTGGGGKYEVAGEVHRGEFVHRQENLQKPGMLGFHYDLWRTDDLDQAYARFRQARGYAVGGLVGGMSAASYAPMAPSAAPARATVDTAGIASAVESALSGWQPVVKLGDREIVGTMARAQAYARRTGGGL